MKSKHLLSITLAIFIVVFAYAEYTINTNNTAGTTQTNTSTTSSPGTIVPSQTNSTSTQSGYTLADVAQHNSQASCWSAINGKVYDLTSWINEHPGGPEHILALCGADGSAAFNTQHGGQGQPAQELAQFYIGDLAQ